MMGGAPPGESVHGGNALGESDDTPRAGDSAAAAWAESPGQPPGPHAPAAAHAEGGAAVSPLRRARQRAPGAEQGAGGQRRQASAEVQGPDATDGERLGGVRLAAMPAWPSGLQTASRGEARKEQSRRHAAQSHQVCDDVDWARLARHPHLHRQPALSHSWADSGRAAQPTRVCLRSGRPWATKS